MGFFKFIRQNDEVQKPEEQKNVTTLQTPVVREAVRQENKIPQSPLPENKAPQPLPENKKKQKDDACDFFNVKIYNIFMHEPVFTKKLELGNGKSVDKFTLNLNKPELSTFNHLDIFKYENGHYDLFFIGNELQMKPELVDFIHYCVGVLGPDFMRKKEFSQEDVRDMKLGIFSRIWREQVRIENIHFKLSLTLYDITPQLS
jgi:hypothetical protein